MTNPERIIIGIHGKKQHGKDTCAEELLELLKDEYPVIIHFADPLYEEVSAVTGVPIHIIKQHKSVFRPLLQWWGTDFKREWNQNDDYWVDQIRLRISNLTPKHRIVLIPDVRFMNEVKFVRSFKGSLLIKVERKFASPLLDSHSSETSLDHFDHFDFVIHNDTLDKFKARIKAAQQLYIQTTR